MSVVRWACTGLLLLALLAVPASGFVAALRPAGLIPLRHGVQASRVRIAARVAVGAPLGLRMSEAIGETGEVVEKPKGKLRRFFGSLRQRTARVLSKIGDAIMGDDEDYVPMEEEDDFDHYEVPEMSEEVSRGMSSMVTAFSRHSMEAIQTQVQATQTQERKGPAPEVKRREMKPIVSREQQQQQAQQNVVVYLTDKLVGVPDVTAELQDLPGAVAAEGGGEAQSAEKAAKQPTRA